MYWRLTVPGVASTETRPERVRSAAGLIAGTVPTKGWPGNFSRSASITSVEAVLQGMTEISGWNLSSSAPNRPRMWALSAGSSQAP